MLMCAGEAPTGLLGGSLFEREIIEFHSTFSRHGNAQASLTLLIWLNEKVQKLSSKINQKFIGVRRSAHLFLGCPSGRNLTESIQNQTESLGSTPKGILRGRRPSGGNLSKIKFKN